MGGWVGDWLVSRLVKGLPGWLVCFVLLCSFAM